MVKEESVRKVNRIVRKIARNPKLTVRAACEQLGVGETWFYKMRKKIKDQSRLKSTMKNEEATCSRLRN